MATRKKAVKKVSPHARILDPSKAKRRPIAKKSSVKFVAVPTVRGKVVAKNAGKARPLRIDMPSVQQLLKNPKYQGIVLKQKRNTIEASLPDRGGVFLTVDAREVRSAKALEAEFIRAAKAKTDTTALPPPAKMSRRQLKAAFEGTAPAVAEKTTQKFDDGVEHIGRLQDISQALVAIDRMSRDLPSIIDILKARGRQEDVSLRAVLGIAECGLYEPVPVGGAGGYASFGGHIGAGTIVRHTVPHPNMLLKSVAEKMYLVANLLMQEADAVSAPGFSVAAADTTPNSMAEEAAEANERG